MSYTRERTCPHCGTRVAQRASTCYACGASLDDSPRHRPTVPWADIALLAVIGGLLAIWWTHPPAAAAPRTPQPINVTPTVDLAALLMPPPTTARQATAAAMTVTPTPPPAQATPVPTPIQHSVDAGETVGEIAEKYGVKLKDLLAINNLDSDGFIRQGQVLTIPGAAIPPTPTLTPTPTGGTLIYKVQEGDTIAGLAEKFHAEIDWIMTANKIKDGDVLSVGQHLLIPLSSSTPAPEATSTSTPVPATFTPAPTMRMPALLTPADHASITGSDPVLLSWTSVGLLADDAWYVVVVRVSGVTKGPDPYWTKATSWRLPADSRPAWGGNVTWQVQVIRGKPGKADPRPIPVSPPSAQGHFTW